MARGVQTVIVGTQYAKEKRAPKPKAPRRVLPARSAKAKRARLVGSGDYRYTYKGDTPYANVGRHLGSKFGLGEWGELLGHGIGRILGSGDYETGAMVKQNVLANSTEVPEFASIGRTNVIAHREFLGDITTSATIGGFLNRSFSVNPGNSGTFPWLSTIGENYEQYKIHGMVFYFKSTSGESVGSTNTALGTVIMASDYNVNAAPYANKSEMENSQYAQSAKASQSQAHGIECDVSDKPLNNYFVRTTEALDSGDSKKWYDFCNFQIATQGFQAANVTIGELWVTYVIEFFKPQVPRNLGGTQMTALIRRTQPSNLQPLGANAISAAGSFGGQQTGTGVTLENVLPGMILQVTILYNCGIASAFTAPTLGTFVGCAAYATVGPNSAVGVPQSNHQAPQNTIPSTFMELSVWLKVNENNYTGVAGFSATGYGGGTAASDTVTIYISEMDKSVLG